MSADTLRRAAAAMREDARSVRRPYAREEHFKLAVADWLDSEAAKQTPTTHLAVTFDGTPMFPVDSAALAVARAYLKEEA